MTDDEFCDVAISPIKEGTILGLMLAANPKAFQEYCALIEKLRSATVLAQAA